MTRHVHEWATWGKVEEQRCTGCGVLRCSLERVKSLEAEVARLRCEDVNEAARIPMGRGVVREEDGTLRWETNEEVAARMRGVKLIDVFLVDRTVLPGSKNNPA